MRVLDQRFRELNVDPRDRIAVWELAAVGITLVGWRNGPLEDWHASPGSCISNAELARASVATTRAVRSVLQATQASGSDHALAAVAEILVDLDRRLPDGRAVAEVAPDEDERSRFVAHVRAAERRWAWLTRQLGEDSTLDLLALAAGWRVSHWWGTPWWPLRVVGFIDRLGKAVPTARPEDLAPRVELLRPQLLDGLDHVEVETVQACLAGGLGDPLSAPRPRVDRHRFAPVLLLLEPDTPQAFCNQTLTDLIIEEIRS